MMKVCDLHTHSDFSDGSLSPAQLVHLAEGAGLSAVALTDHNTVGGLKLFTEAAASCGIIGVPGCEFSTDYNDLELHIVGLFLPEKHWEDVERYVFSLKAAKKLSNEDLIANLRGAGLDITYEEVAGITNAGEFNRAHVARVLTEKGYTQTPAEAFERFLGERQGYYHPGRRPDVFSTIAFIRAVGGVPVLAHPFLCLSPEALRRFLPTAKQCGLIGMETLYAMFTAAETALAADLARTFGLLQSGGSDYHGAVNPEVSIGTGLGSLQVPFAFYEALKAAAVG
ncbi:MAG: PHP domain-containing protein [Clostridia bacterium]|nr:PHP domain-containing protein [Clostridia bacterium]